MKGIYQPPTSDKRARREFKPYRPATEPTVRPLCLVCMSRVCPHFDEAPPHLSAQLVRIVQLLTGGLSNKEIAWELKISEGTVKTYLSERIFPALGLTSRLEVALWGMWHAPELAEFSTSFIDASFLQAPIAGDGIDDPTEESAT